MVVNKSPGIDDSFNEILDFKIPDRAPLPSAPLSTQASNTTFEDKVSTPD